MLDLGHLTDWTKLSVAVRVAKAQLGPDGGHALLKALQNGLIRADGIKVETAEHSGFRDIHLFTADFVGWLVEYSFTKAGRQMS